MPRKKREIEVTCSFCGDKTSTFTANAAGKLFCHIGGAIGVPPRKDCFTDYLKHKEKENVRKKQLQEEHEKRLFEEKEKLKKEKEIAKPRLNKKLEEFYEQFGVSKEKRNYL